MGMWAFIPSRGDEIGLVLPTLTFGRVAVAAVHAEAGGLSLCTPGSAKGPPGAQPGVRHAQDTGAPHGQPFPSWLSCALSLLYTERGMVVDLFNFCDIFFYNSLEVFVTKAVHWHIKHFFQWVGLLTVDE